MANDTAASLCGAKLGNHRVERILGRGRMGIVYLAHDEALLRPAALKLLRWQEADSNGQDPEEWFLAEARSVARINHPNVVQIYGVARQGPHCYITMEYVAGGSVDVLIANKGPFTPVRATELLIQCASALQAAHDAGIVHRDIKPENILIGADGNAKLGDFGMALHVTKPRAHEPARAGTPFYTAPEIWNGEAATPKTDLYALGATYYFMLTGRVPFRARDLPTLIAAHLNSPIPSLELADPQQLAACTLIVRKCLAKASRDRYSSARALVTEARNVLQSLSPGRPAVHANSTNRGSSSLTQPATPASSTPELGTKSTSRRPQPISFLLRWAESPDSKVAVLVGEPGSGKTTQLQGLIELQAEMGTVVYYDGRFSTHGANKTFGGADYERLTGVAGLSADGQRQAPDWDRVVAQCGSNATLFVIDGSVRCRRDFRDLVAALTARHPKGRWRVVVADSLESGTEWRELQKQLPELGLVIHEVPRLTLKQSYAYVRERLLDAASRRSPVIMTPDAMLLAAYFGMGNPGRINNLIESLVDAVSAEPGQVLTTWGVWEIQFRDVGEKTAPAHRPEKWPTTQVLELLNQCRRQCGLPARR